MSEAEFKKRHEVVKQIDLVDLAVLGRQEVQSYFAADYDLVSGDRGVDRAWYLRTYPDVSAAEMDPVEHYLWTGWREGRDPRPDFSTSGYLEANKEAEGNPLLHYLRSTREAHSGDMPVTDWYFLWKKGLLHPKGGDEFLPNSAFGSRGVPKIVFAGHEASRTGAPLILLRLMEAVQTLTGAELYLILDRSGPLLQDYQRIAHVIVNHGGMLHRPNGPRIASLLNSMAPPSAELAICNCADSWRLTIALREAGLRSVVTLIHERVNYCAPDAWRSIHQHSSRIIFPAEVVKAATTSVLPFFSDARVIPQGLLNPEFGHGDRNAARLELRSRLGLSPEASVILGCGTRDMRKGADLFVQLAALVRARTKRDVHFVWLGARDREFLFSKMIDLDLGLLNLRSTVSLLDEVADPEPYFLAADAFALTSRDDPFPCVIHEAMACALPIVTFDGSGGAKEALSGDCGIVVPYLDMEAMALALTSIIEQPSEHAPIGQRAQSRVHSVYRFSDYAERIWEICNALGPGLNPITVTSHGATALATRTGGVKRPDQRAPLPERKQRLDVLLGKVGRLIRTEQWWDHKLVPIYSVFYATAYMQHVSIASIWSTTVTLLLAIAPCAAYVSLINDLADRADDRWAGKTNRMEGKPLWQMALLISAPLCAAVFFSILWRDDIPLVAAYLGAWAAFSLYSVPPLRLKNRGLLGVIADASGSHVFPTLTAVFMACRATGNPVDPVWTAAAAAWALGCGLRGILWHQFYDVEADRKAAVQTFVVRHSRRTALGLARVALLVELVGLGMLLWQIKSLWAVVFLLTYAAFATLRSRIRNITIVIAEPCGQYSILGQEYYTLLFPVSLLLSSALHYPADWVVLIAHLIVFPRLAVAFIRETRLLAQCSLGSGSSMSDLR